MKPRRRTGRENGFTLIEMVMVIGGLTIVLGLCGSLLHALLRLDRAGRASFNDATTVSRLARQFRADVRSSRTAKAERNDALELSRPDGPSISYSLEGTELRRSEREGDRVRRREAYHVGRLGPLGFRIEGPFVRLSLARQAHAPNAPPRAPVSVEARLDKDRAEPSK